MPTTVFHDTSLSFLPLQWNPEQQYCTVQQLSSFNYLTAGNASSPGSSSDSSISSSSNMGSTSPVRSPDTTTAEDLSNGCKPFLQMVEEPGDRFRFRYKTEMQGTHGSILGVKSQLGKKRTYPKVRLCNYKPQVPGEKLIIRCTLYTAEDDESKRTLHVHRLVGKYSGTEKDDPHDIVVRAPHYVAEFQNMTILFTKKEEQVDVLVNKKKNHTKKKFSGDTNRPSNFKMINDNQLKEMANDELLSMNLNVAYLRFDALVDIGQGVYTSICPPIYSNSISNMKSAGFNILRISKVDRLNGSCAGGEEIFMFVEKVVKDNIKVKFYEEDKKTKEILWTAYATFTPEDVHHQYGIVFRTPPYRNTNIEENVTVYFQLERPSDHAVSDPKRFEYTPIAQSVSRKRPRQDSPTYPTTLSEFEGNPQRQVPISPVPRYPSSSSHTNIPSLSRPVNPFQVNTPRTVNSPSNIVNYFQANIPSVVSNPAPRLSYREAHPRSVVDNSCPVDLAMPALFNSPENEQRLLKDIHMESLQQVNSDLLLHVLGPEFSDGLVQENMDFSANIPFTGNLCPSAESDIMSTFLNSGLLQNYSEVVGEREAYDQLMSGQVSSSQPDMQFDGHVEPQVGKQQTIDEEDVKPPLDLSAAVHQSGLVVSDHQNPRYSSPRQKLIERYRSANTQGDWQIPRQPDAPVPPSLLMERCSIGRPGRVQINEDTIVESVENIVLILTKLEAIKKITEKNLQNCLKRLFTYRVGTNEDSVFHILAAVDSLPLPKEAVRFISLLKMHSLCQTVINTRNIRRETPLLVAAGRGSPEMISLLLDAGADVNATDDCINSSMHLAVLRKQGAMDAMAALLKKRPNLNINNGDGLTVLHLAVTHRKSDLVSSLLIKSEEECYRSDLINEGDGKHGNTALHIAVYNRFKEVVNLLLNFEQIDVNAKNCARQTPLAFVYGKPDQDAKKIEEQLLLNKADPSLVETTKKEELKVELDSESDTDIVDQDDYEEPGESLSAYAREWADTELFDKATVTKLCPLLDKENEWMTLARKLKYKDDEINYCKIHWSPTLLIFKMAALYKQEITAETIRDHLMNMAPRLREGAQFIDDMLLQKLGL